MLTELLPVKTKMAKTSTFTEETTASPGGAVPAKTTVTRTFSESKNERYGKGLVWWTTPETAFENEFTRTGKALTSAELTAAGAPAKPASLADSAAATNGLVRIGGGLSTLGQELNWNSEEKKWEDHHNTTTRIFGNYHLAYADLTGKNPGVKPVTLNSFKGAKSFIAEYETGKETKATQYSLGAVPMTPESRSVRSCNHQPGYRRRFGWLPGWLHS